MDNNQEFIFFEAPKIVAPELRLYYNDDGTVKFYTCEKPEGKYIVIDHNTYAQCRYDIRVIDGKISSINPKAIIAKLKPDITGIKCHKEDISLIVNESDVNYNYWNLKIYELK